MQGLVKWYDESKGYGFITSKQGNDIFVHWKQIITKKDGRSTLSEGQNVQFETEDGIKGLQAIDVSVI